MKTFYEGGAILGLQCLFFMFYGLTKFAPFVECCLNMTYHHNDE